MQPRGLYREVEEYLVKGEGIALTKVLNILITQQLEDDLHWRTR